MKIKISYEFQLFFCLVIFIAVLVCLSGCKDKFEWEPEPEPIYEICNVRIDSIIVDPDTLLEDSKKYLNIMTQYYVFINRDQKWVWSDRKYEDRAIVTWLGHSCQFSFELKEPNMAIEIKPATCPGIIKGFRMTINDSIVRFSGESRFIRIKLNN